MFHSLKFRILFFNLGYTLHYRLPAGSWEELYTVSSGSHVLSSVKLSTLPCGTLVHIYGTAWNQYGVSSASSVVIGKTSGSAPPRPEPQNLVEVNESCVTLRLYAWPERGCRITGWKVSKRLHYYYINFINILQVDSFANNLNVLVSI